jgi:hypothetical protein
MGRLLAEQTIFVILNLFQDPADYAVPEEILKQVQDDDSVALSVP